MLKRECSCFRSIIASFQFNDQHFICLIKISLWSGGLQLQQGGKYAAAAFIYFLLPTVEFLFDLPLKPIFFSIPAAASCSFIAPVEPWIYLAFTFSLLFWNLGSGVEFKVEGFCVFSHLRIMAYFRLGKGYRVPSIG